jgi:predicted DNA-binding transcriptional regulator AlpA
MDRDHLSQQEALEYLQISGPTLWKLCKNNEYFKRAKMKIGKKNRYDKELLKDALKMRENRVKI